MIKINHKKLTKTKSIEITRQSNTRVEYIFDSEYASLIWVYTLKGKGTISNMWTTAQSKDLDRRFNQVNLRIDKIEEDIVEMKKDIVDMKKDIVDIKDTLKLILDKLS